MIMWPIDMTTRPTTIQVIAEDSAPPYEALAARNPKMAAISPKITSAITSKWTDELGSSYIQF
jgi:hypothetical protein